MRLAFVLSAALCGALALAAADTSPVCRLRSVVRQGSETVTSNGSAVMIGKKHLLTAWHVVDDKGAAILAEIAPMTWKQCKVSAASVEIDLALLECIDELPTQAPIFSGQPYFMIASGEGKKVTVSSGVVISATGNFGDMLNGKSGGGIFNACGELVGIVVSGLADEKKNMRRDVTNFVGIGAIKNFLAESGVKYESVPREK